MSEVRIRVYGDQLGDVRVEVDGRPVIVGTSIPEQIDDVDVVGFVRRVIKGLVDKADIENTIVTG